MARLIVAQLHRRVGRATALLLGVLLATTGFAVLTGSTATSQLTVAGTVNEHSRGAYDILVRPKGARTNLEEQRGLVRANFLAGQYGGITEEQWKRIATLDGVETAAPIAMMGYATTLIDIAIDVTDAVDRSLETQLIRVHVNWRGDRGLTNAPDVAPSVVYVTKRPVIRLKRVDVAGPMPYADGKERPPGACGPEDPTYQPPYEVEPDGTELPICLDGLGGMSRHNPDGRSFASVVHLTPQGTFEGLTESPRLITGVGVPMALLVAAIDPTAEAALVGLERAVTKGRYLAADDPPIGVSGAQWAPVLIAGEPYLDESLDTVTDVVAGPALAGKSLAQVVHTVRESAATAQRPAQSRAVRDVYRDKLGRADLTNHSYERSVTIQFFKMMQSGPASYDTLPDGTLRPREAPEAATAWTGDGSRATMPWLANDAAQRATAVAQVMGESGFLIGAAVGVFDPTRLSTGDGLATSLDTYTQAKATGADERSRGLLGGHALLPNSNPGGYLATSPTVLMSLNTLWQGGGPPDAISAIRVRVAGVTGLDALSRERVRLTAEDIAAATGLDVEVMLGASGAPQTIDLGPGKFGRPQLTLAELWSKKGVAAAIVQAIDRKSVILFGLILFVCILFLANAAAAAVRDRRRELAILSCLGWARHRLAGLIIGEVAVIGLLAGVISALLARPIATAMHIDVSAGRAWLSIPVAIGLCTVAAAVPAWRASRTHPAGAVHRASAAPGRRGGRPRRGVLGLALANLRRTPGRTALGAVALAVGIGGLTLIAAITWAFHGTVTGSLLGDAVSIRVRGVDLVAVVATVLIGVVAVADVLYLNVRDRAAEFAALQATGWSDAALGRLIAYEGLGIGTIGAIVGAGAGLGAAAMFVGQPPVGLLWTVVVTAGVGPLLAAAAAVIPAVLQRRVPMSILLAEE